MGSSSTRVRGYRTRRPMRAVLLAVILSIVAGLVWFNALHQTQAGCTSGNDAAASEPLPVQGLDAVAPAPPQFTRVQVLNADGVVGEATVINAALTQLGFATTAPANDPRYPAFNLRCYGEIRFGTAGQAGARTLSLALPCAELVRDDRPDPTIELALGTRFSAMRPNNAAHTALLDLTELGRSLPAQPSPRGGLAAPVGSQPLPRVNSDLLRQAHQVPC